MPNENFIYFGDLKNIPYGNKSKSQLIEFADNIFKFFETKNAKAAVMACNTTSAATYNELRDKYNFKIYPIIQSCAGVISSQNIERIGVFATEATINSHAYEREITARNNKIEVIEMSCPGWVQIVESASVNEEENIKKIHTQLEKMLSTKSEKIILGCTHYPYLLDVLSKIAPRDMFIDPSMYFAKFIAQDLEKLGLLNPSIDERGQEEFFVSANPENFISASKMFYEVKTLPQLVEFALQV